MNMVAENPGRPLFPAQTIEKAIKDIMSDPSVALALPRIPGKSDYEINREDDISVIGAQGGMIFTQATAPATDDTTKLLLLREKIRAIKDLDSKVPGIYTRILGIESKEVFLDFAEAIRKNRNKIAHPSSSGIIKGDLAMSGLSPDYRRYAKSLLEWDPTTT
jgi:hypothetical protein